MNYPTYNRPTKRKDIPSDVVRLPTYNRVGGVAVGASAPTDPRRAYGLPRVVNQSNADAAFVRGQSVGDATGDASADTSAAQLPTYNPPSIIEGASPKQLPTINPAMLTRQRMATGTPGEANPRPPLEQAQARLRGLLTDPVTDQNGRLASGGLGALSAAGQAARSGSLAYTLGAALGGLAGGAIRPQGDEERKRREDIQKAATVYGMETQADKERRDSEKEASDAGYRKAQIDYIRARPGIAYEGLKTKRDIAAGGDDTRRYGIDQRTDVALDRNDITAQKNSDVVTFNDWRMKNGDKRTDGYLDFTKWRQTNGDRNSYTREQFNQWRMDHGDEMTDIAGQNADSNTMRANRPPVAPRSQNTGGGSGSNGRISRAQGAINGFQKLFTQKTQALNRGDHRTAEMLDGQIRTAGSNIRSVFGDVVDNDANGWPTVLKSQGGQSGQAGRQGSSQRVATQSDVAEYARQTGVDAARAAEHFRASGYAIQ
ncbi:MAG: hypothetical protein ACR2LC_14355 [Pyrinomonadaceae bacterium]